MIYALGQADCWHPFPVARPLLRQCRESESRTPRVSLGAALQMSQQQRFMACVLPDESEARALCSWSDLGITMWRNRKLVIVQKDETTLILPVTRRAFIGTLGSKFDDRKWITATWLKQDSIEIDRDAQAIRDARQQSNVALLAFALASDEDPAALRDGGASLAAHPMLGSAP